MQIPKRSRGTGGFTLIELMISAAIIGLLSAIAIPNFLTFQARGRRSEAYSNLGALGRAYKSYHAEKGAFPDMEDIAGEKTLPVPPDATYPSTDKMSWDVQTQGFFDNVGWQSEGGVFYTYEVNAGPGNCGLCNPGQCFTAVAFGDTDGDGNVGAIYYVHPEIDATGAVVGSCKSDVYPALSGPVDSNGDEIFDAPRPRFADFDDY